MDIAEKDLQVKLPDGTLKPYDEQRVAGLILMAQQAIGSGDREMAEGLAIVVTNTLLARELTIISQKDLYDSIEHLFTELGHPQIVRAFRTNCYKEPF